MYFRGDRVDKVLVEAVVVHRHDEAKEELLNATELDRSLFIVIRFFLGMLLITAVIVIVIALVAVWEACWGYCLEIRFFALASAVVKIFATTTAAATMTTINFVCVHTSW